MIKVISKGTDEYMSLNISQKELDCKCSRLDCNWTLYSDKLLQLFEGLRTSCGNKILNINSGHRCQKHNGELDGSSNYSKHVLGLALDIEKPRSLSFAEFVYRANQIGFDIVIPYENENFIHVHLKPDQGVPA